MVQKTKDWTQFFLVKQLWFHFFQNNEISQPGQSTGAVNTTGKPGGEEVGFPFTPDPKYSDSLIAMVDRFTDVDFIDEYSCVDYSDDDEEFCDYFIDAFMQEYD